ncbi:MAG TPA: NAD(P)/FAD-dependent oxidoreductase [Candidatus Limnocylindrales bacterium]
MTTEQVEIAIVGGGPAGAVLAALLARAGHEVVILERAPEWRWRASGVFTSPVAVVALRRMGLDHATLRAVARPIPAMRVETVRGTTFRLTYGTETGGEPAVGFDRSTLDPALLTMAEQAGAEARRGWTVTGLDPAVGLVELRRLDGSLGQLRADVVVGADGLRSVVAVATGVRRRSRLGPHVGLTYHLHDPDPEGVHDARMRVLHDGYVGIAPVAGGRVNVGIVLGQSWRATLARRGAAAIADGIVATTPPTADDAAAWRTSERTDAIVGASPLGHRVTRRAGARWLLVGDAAGFLDPFTGEGLHRALISAELGAAAVHARARGQQRAFEAYEHAMQRRFLAKDGVSWLVQAFLTRPALFEYAARRIADRSAVRATMGLVMGDLVPPSRALDPRYLIRLLAP